MIVAAFSFFGSWILYKVTDLIIPLRVTEEQEEIGLDLSQHGEVMQGEMTVPAAAADVREDGLKKKPRRSQRPQRRIFSLAFSAFSAVFSGT